MGPCQMGLWRGPGDTRHRWRAPPQASPRPGIARSSALPQPSGSSWHSHVLPCQGVSDERGGKQGARLCYRSINKVALKAAFRSKRKHHQNLGGGANPGVLQPQQIPSQDQSLGVAQSPRYSSCYRVLMGANSSRQPVAVLNCKQTPSFRGSQARATPSESQPWYHHPALPAKTAPTEGRELDAPLKPSHLQTLHRFSSSHRHQLRDALCPPGTAPGTLHSTKLPRGALAGPVPPALGLRNHWFWKRNRISGNSSQDDAVMEAAPQARRLLSLNVLSWHHQRGLCPLPGAPVRSGLRLSQEPMKTSTAQAGKCLSILRTPTVAQTRGKRPDAAHPLADP